MSRILELQGEIRELRLISLERRIWGDDLIETFKIINGISNYGWNLFNISSQTENLLSRQILKTKSMNQLDFFANRIIHFWNDCLIRSWAAIVYKILRWNCISSEK